MRFPFPGKTPLPPLETVMNEAVALCRQDRAVDAEALLRQRLNTI